MVAGYGQADLAVRLEAAGGGQKPERGRPEGVRGRQDDPAVVEAAVVGRAGRPAQRKVPLEEVGLEGRGGVVWGWGGGELLGFAH